MLISKPSAHHQRPLSKIGPRWVSTLRPTISMVYLISIRHLPVSIYTSYQRHLPVSIYTSYRRHLPVSISTSYRRHLPVLSFLSIEVHPDSYDNVHSALYQTMFIPLSIKRCSFRFTQRCSFRPPTKFNLSSFDKD